MFAAASQSLKAGNCHPEQAIHLSLERDCFDARHPLLSKRTRGKAGGFKVAVVPIKFFWAWKAVQLMVCQ